MKLTPTPMNLTVKIKKLVKDAVIPTYSKPGDAGMDLTAISMGIDGKGNIVYHTGLAFEIPEGYVGLVYPRSSNSNKRLVLTNSVGVIDSGYRGEVTMKYKQYTDQGDLPYVVGDRVGQIIIMPYPNITFEETDELSETERGIGGYGSTGK